MLVDQYVKDYYDLQPSCGFSIRELCIILKCYKKSEQQLNHIQIEILRQLKLTTFYNVDSNDLIRT